MKCKSLSATGLSAKITGRVKILKIKHVKEMPVYYNLAAPLIVEFSHSSSPKISKDISKANVYVTVKEFMLLEL